MTPAPRVLFLVTALSLGVSCAAYGQADNAKGKISRNVYRMPYSSGQSVLMAQDYRDHGNTPAGDFGSMDMFSSSGGTRFIVAAAAGTVTGVSDNLNGCGCHSAYGPCGNFVQIDHANGERSFYLHLVQNSATSRGIVNNLVVAAGTILGVEGDVGWTCGGGTAPRTSSCVPTVPSGAGNCGPHLHWNVRRISTGERVNPMTCGIPNYLYADDGTNTSAACSATACSVNVGISTTRDVFGEWTVVQATNQITAGTSLVINMGSLVLHAGSSVRMTPGFHADAGGYVRAEIGLCNTTAVASIPIPAPATASETPDDSLLLEIDAY